MSTKGWCASATAVSEPEPALARSWSVSDDGRRYTFRLRQGVRFPDGTPFDAEAVRFNFERMLDAEHPFHGTGPFPLAFFFEPVARVEVVDRHTVTLHLSKPFARCSPTWPIPPA